MDTLGPRLLPTSRVFLHGTAQDIGGVAGEADRSKALDAALAAGSAT